MRILLFLFIAVASVVKVSLDGYETKIINYFNSGTFTTLQEKWQNQRKSFENALVLVLQENYGHRGMNVYVRNMPDSYNIADGFYFSDNVVNAVLLQMRLQDLPSLVAPEVTFALASNMLHIQATLSKIIINTKYILMRNQSDVVFNAPDQDPYKKSPFSFQQVQENGDLTIVADDCTLTGYAIASLSGESVNLGHNTLKVTDCKFSIEIYSEKVGSPPIITPYFSKEQSLVLEGMLNAPIRGELLPKLQGSVYTYVNTSAIFGSDLPELRYKQHKVFDDTSKYITQLVRSFVKTTIKENQGILQLKPLEVSWNGECLEGTCRTYKLLTDMVLYGVDTAYSAHSGGPFNLQSTKVAETIRFSTMQVRGKFYFENVTVKGECDYVVEMRDVAVSIEMEAKSNSFVLVPEKLYLSGWRTFEFSIVELDIDARERKVAQSFISGHLINEIPKTLLDVLIKSFGNEEANTDNITENKDKSVESFEGSNAERSGKKKKVVPNTVHISENEV